MALWRRHINPSSAARILCVLLGSVSLLSSGCQMTGSGKSKESGRVVSPKSGTTPVSPATNFPKNPTPEQEFGLHMDLGKVYESQANHEAAVAEYQKALEVCSKEGRLSRVKLDHTHRALAERRTGAALDHLGQFAQAETHYKSAIKLAPNDARTWNDLGYSYYMQGKYADAERSLARAEKAEPNNSRVLTNLGLVLAAEGKNNQALAMLSRASGPAAASANLGFMLAAMGKTEEAKGQYERALNLQPQLAAAREAIARLDAQKGGRNAVTAPVLAAKSNSIRPVATRHLAGTSDPEVARTSTAPKNDLSVLPTPPIPSRIIPSR